MKFITAAQAMRGSPASGYGLAILTFAIALFLRYELAGILPPGFPYLTFFPAIILTAFVAGTGPGVLCAILSGLASWYFFIPPYNSFSLGGSTALALVFYVFIVSVDISLLHFMRVAADRLRAQQDVTARLYDQQSIMFKELQHRVANNMTFVASLLHLQKRKVEAEPADAATTFDEAIGRIETMSRVHRRLYDPASVELPVGDYFRDLVTDLIEASGAGHVRCAVDMPASVRLDISRLMTLSLLVTEVVTNSLKHAFAGRAAGTIRLSMVQPDAGHLCLAIADDGVGIATTDTAPARRGLGTRIVAGLASQLDGRLEVTSDAGVTTRVTFPA